MKDGGGSEITQDMAGSAQSALSEPKAAQLWQLTVNEHATRLRCVDARCKRKSREDG